MTKQILIVLFILGNFTTFSQVGIGTTTPDDSAIIELESTTKGFLMPRMTEVQMNAIATPAEGLMVYCLNCTPRGLYINLGAGLVPFIESPLIADRNYDDPAGNHRFYYATATSNTGKVWLNNNLGANYANTQHPSYSPHQQAATSNDANAYGSLYQWGRYSDGHELNGSTAVTGTSATSTVVGSNSDKFLAGSVDWYTGSNHADLWTTSGAGGINNPCPIGYRIPSQAEAEAERVSWDPVNANRKLSTAFASPLKFSGSGWRSELGHTTINGNFGRYWLSETIGTTEGSALFFATGSTTANGKNRAWGLSIRCIKN